MTVGINPDVRERRVAYGAAVEITDSERNIFYARFRNISRRGFGINPFEELVVGEFISLRGRRSTALGQILWSSGHEAGGMFVEDPALVA